MIINHDFFSIASVTNFVIQYVFFHNTPPYTDGFFSLLTLFFSRRYYYLSSIVTKIIREEWRPFCCLKNAQNPGEHREKTLQKTPSFPPKLKLSFCLLEITMKKHDDKRPVFFQFCKFYILPIFLRIPSPTDAAWMHPISCSRSSKYLVKHPPY